MNSSVTHLRMTVYKAKGSIAALKNSEYDQEILQRNDHIQINGHCEDKLFLKQSNQLSLVPFIILYYLTKSELIAVIVFNISSLQNIMTF